LYGKREDKYKRLLSKSFDTVDFKKLENTAPNYFMVQKDLGLQKKYDKFIGVNELFNQNSL
jgi:hypothetical protein